MKLIEVMLSDSVGILSLITVVLSILIIAGMGAFFMFGGKKDSTAE